MNVENLTKDGFDMMNEYFVSINFRDKNYVKQMGRLYVTSLDILGIKKIQSVIFTVISKLDFFFLIFLFLY